MRYKTLLQITSCSWVQFSKLCESIQCLELVIWSSQNTGFKIFSSVCLIL